ncbi:dTDP-4-dehydrorhamnose reductase [Halanaerobium salsuginis]|uniref:dTDP-4-dehydrorhamnose reductase n=1 Tax=Halanaerobium salsuginis TaxID=29563 RepID=A0A1I4N1D7_9FIRM|nr:dTDP-4-dehydrorhamnose reductase [Halanaerobium salsuginis]SFM09341.1 dTDP-4-dehydrorhamnose reductase [Halanaerobium salsuginis]
MGAILLVGSSGQLGLELQKQLKDKNFEYITLDLPKFDITELDLVIEKITNEKLDIIINCAAYTDVDGCENNKETAFKVNALGAKNLAIAAEKIGAKLVHVSTDYIFNGQGEKPYKEYEHSSPQTVYGKSKLLGEKYVEQFSSKFFIFRTAWLYGDGNNFVRTMLRLAEENEELNVVNDQIGSPTSTVDLAKTIIDLMETEHYGLYHATCEGQCSWYDFAKKIFEIKNIDIKVSPVSSDEFKRAAERPKYSVLDNYMLKLIDKNNFRYWEESLEEYLEME